MPLVKDLLNLLEKGQDTAYLIGWRSELGIMCGLQLSVLSNFDIISLISEGFVVLIRKVSELEFSK